MKSYLKTGHLKRRQSYFTRLKVVQKSNVCIINGLQMHIDIFDFCTRLCLHGIWSFYCSSDFLNLEKLKDDRKCTKISPKSISTFTAKHFVWSKWFLLLCVKRSKSDWFSFQITQVNFWVSMQGYVLHILSGVPVGIWTWGPVHTHVSGEAV